MEQEHKPKQPEMLGAFNLFRPSMDAISLNIGTILLLLAAVVGAFIFSFVLALAASHSTPFLILSILCGFALLAFLVVVLSAFVPLGLKGIRGVNLNFNESLTLGRRYALRLLGLWLVTGLVILVGLLLLIVPGIFMIKRYILSPYYLVDKNLGIFEAMNQSAKDAKQFSGPVWGMLGVMLLLSLAGIIPIIGWAASIAQLLYTFAPAKRYVEIQDALGHHSRHAGHAQPAS
jgi:hypothetical protein